MVSGGVIGRAGRVGVSGSLCGDPREGPMAISNAHVSTKWQREPGSPAPDSPEVGTWRSVLTQCQGSLIATRPDLAVRAVSWRVAKAAGCHSGGYGSREMKAARGRSLRTAGRQCGKDRRGAMRIERDR